MTIKHHFFWKEILDPQLTLFKNQKSYICTNKYRVYLKLSKISQFQRKLLTTVRKCFILLKTSGWSWIIINRNMNKYIFLCTKHTIIHNDSNLMTKAIWRNGFRFVSFRLRLNYKALIIREYEHLCLKTAFKKKVVADRINRSEAQVNQLNQLPKQLSISMYQIIEICSDVK